MRCATPSFSQAAFQEFLKRIPSATNLAANQQFEPNQLQQAQQLLSASGSAGGAAAANVSAGLSEAAQGHGGMPRVPSLDVLRQLVIQNQLGQGVSQPGMPKAEASGGEGAVAQQLEMRCIGARAMEARERADASVTHAFRCQLGQYAQLPVSGTSTQHTCVSPASGHFLPALPSPSGTASICSAASAVRTHACAVYGKPSSRPCSAFCSRGPQRPFSARECARLGRCSEPCTDGEPSSSSCCRPAAAAAWWGFAAHGKFHGS